MHTKLHYRNTTTSQKVQKMQKVQKVSFPHPFSNIPIIPVGHAHQIVNHHYNFFRSFEERCIEFLYDHTRYSFWIRIVKNSMWAHVPKYVFWDTIKPKRKGTENFVKHPRNGLSLSNASNIQDVPLATFQSATFSSSLNKDTKISHHHHPNADIQAGANNIPQKTMKPRYTHASPPSPNQYLSLTFFLFFIGDYSISTNSFWACPPTAPYSNGVNFSPSPSIFIQQYL